MPDPLTIAAVIAGVKTAKELFDNFSELCSSVKGAAESGKELVGATGVITSIFSAEDKVEELKERAKDRGDLAEMQELVRVRAFIRDEKKKTEFVLSWACPTGMYQDWCEIKEANRDMKERATTKEKTLARKQIQKDDDIQSAIIATVVAGVIALAVVFALR